MGNFAENLNLGNRFRPPLLGGFVYISSLFNSRQKEKKGTTEEKLQVLCPKLLGNTEKCSALTLLSDAHFTTFACAFLTVTFYICLTIGYVSFDAKINK